MLGKICFDASTLKMADPVLKRCACRSSDGRTEEFSRAAPVTPNGICRIIVQTKSPTKDPPRCGENTILSVAGQTVLVLLNAPRLFGLRSILAGRLTLLNIPVLNLVCCL